MDSVWIATIQAFPESMGRSRGERSARQRRKQTYLIVTCGAGVVCGNRVVPGAQSSITRRCFNRGRDRRGSYWNCLSKQVALSR